MQLELNEKEILVIAIETKNRHTMVSRDLESMTKNKSIYSKKYFDSKINELNMILEICKDILTQINQKNKSDNIGNDDAIEKTA